MRLRKAQMSRLYDQKRPLGWPVLVIAVCGGLVAGAFAQLLGQLGEPFSSRVAVAYLGWATAVWVSVGFLFAWPAARARSVARGTLWAGAAMALYLFAWLFSYCLVFGFYDSGGFLMLWRDERVYELATIPVSAVVGLIAAGAWRPGAVGSACLAAPIVWSAPELIQSVVPQWLFGQVSGASRLHYALALGLPTLVVALIPVLRARPARMSWVVFAAVAVIGGATAYFALRLFDRFVF